MVKLFNSDYKLIDMDLVSKLNKDNQLIILTHLKPPYDVVLGAPHQTSLNSPNICQLVKARKGDINSGILAMGIFYFLTELDIPTKLVIKSKELYVDPNKNENSDYLKEIFKDKAKLLFEIHGQGNRNNTPLEFSGGMNNLSKISRLILYLYEEIRQLQKRDIITKLYSFAFQEIPETSKAIIFKNTGELNSGKLILPALKSLSITKAEELNIPSIHLECTRRYRYTNKEYKLTKDGINISTSLSKAIYKYLYDSSFTDKPN